MYEIREILPADIPIIHDPLLGDHPATHQDLLNMGLVRIGNTDYFNCVGVFEDGRGQHKPGDKLPGTSVVKGLDRHKPHKLPKTIAMKVLNAAVFRNPAAKKGQGKASKSSPDVEFTVVPMKDVDEEDFVVEDYIPPAKFTGES